MRFLGCRGTTGTEASFMDLFDGDGGKIDEMNRRIAASFGFDRCFSVCGQTYPRKVDSRILNVPERHRVRARTAWRATSACCSTTGRLRSRSRSTRSARPPWPTSATPCAASASARSAAISWPTPPNAPMTACDPVARAHARRLRQPPHLPARRAFCARTRCCGSCQNVTNGPAREREGRRPRRAGVSAVPRDGEHHDGGRQARRRPSGAAREHPAALHGRDRAHEGGGAL